MDACCLLSGRGWSRSRAGGVSAASCAEIGSSRVDRGFRVRISGFGLACGDVWCSGVVSSVHPLRSLPPPFYGSGV
ncbi:hypothetical protein YC2023_116603 [Brassica napus]